MGDGKLGDVSTFGSTLVVSGTEQLLASRLVDERRSAALAEQPGADVNRLEAVELEGSMLAEVVGGSLFSSHIVAIIDDVGATPPDVVDQLVATAVDPGPDLCLVLVHQGGNKGKGLMDKLKKAKVPVETVAAPKPWELPGFCQREAKRLGVGLATDAAEALVAAVGSDLRALVAAIGQLADDASGEHISPALVQRYFAGRAEVTSFAVADAVIAGNVPLAVERLRWALNTGAAPVLVTSAMASAFRGMGKYLDAQGMRMNKFELAKQLGIPHWKIDEYARSSRRWEPGAVARAIQLVAQADADVKGAAGDPEYALERMVLGVLAQRRT